MLALNEKEEQFFIRHLRAVLIYRIFKEKLLRRFPDTFVYVQKTQITFAIRHVFACVSFLRVRKKGELPAPYLTVIFGMPYRLYTDRDKVVSEPYPGGGRHILSSAHLIIWMMFFQRLTEPYAFAMEK